MSVLGKTDQILKCREDHVPLYFKEIADAEGDGKAYQLFDKSKCSWLKNSDKVGIDQFHSRIEPWLTALFQSEHFSLLIGSGLTHAVHHLATGKALPGMAEAEFAVFNDEIKAAAGRSAEAAGRDDWNIEDQIRTANELLVGLEHFCPEGSTWAHAEALRSSMAVLKAEIAKVLGEFAADILKGERGLVTVDKAGREKAFSYLVNFIMSFASRSGIRDRLQIFTTNYDRVIEAGADVAGLHLLDRFVGSLTPIFRSSRLDIDMHYCPPGIRGEPRYLEGVARFTKLHGSLDWVYAANEIRRMGVPFGADGIGQYLKVPSLGEAGPMQLMIYPNSAKDRETSAYPYVELFRDFAVAVCRPNSTVVTYGYSFGDEHINRVIEDMLTIPSTHLVIISRSDPLGRIMKTYNKLSRPDQITLLIGSHFGDFQTLVDNYLPKSAIDRTTIRMADLLKSRYGFEPKDGKPSNSEPSEVKS
ncbi:fibronectin-binding protein (FBP) [Geomonas terrae]|uniref:Fibronectin-binding protein (FBP) n=1 Tax=Geomonas terrae TaxID=2562681 RepID=A0A4S1CMU6_9BACT|nr:SIR2 family protein [Geomonas terrae]TGU74576.1 fibronectin-binding protein (FBP) [Geomonas terrae]